MFNMFTNQAQRWTPCLSLSHFSPSTQAFHIPGSDKWESSSLLGVFPCRLWSFIILFLHYHCNKDSLRIDRLKYANIDLTDSPSLANTYCSPTLHLSKASESTPLNNLDTQPMTLSPNTHILAPQTDAFWSYYTHASQLHWRISLNTSSNGTSKTTLKGGGEYCGYRATGTF